MAIIGNKIIAAPQYRLVDDAGQNQIATSLGNQIIAPNSGWATLIGVFAQRVNGTPSIYLALWSNGTDGRPALLIGRTASMLVTATAMNYEAPIEFTTTESQTAARFGSGDVIHAGLVVTGGDIQIGQSNGFSISDWTRAVGNSTPTSPFLPDFNLSELPLAFYINYVNSNAPNAPVGMTPTNNSTSLSLTPTYTGGFSDADVASPLFDEMYGMEIEVRDPATMNILWGGSGAVFLAGDHERDTGSISRVYNGTPLIAGQQTIWRMRMADTTTTWGAWSPYFTLTNSQGPTITTLTQPSGKKDGPTNDIAWAGTYTYAGGAADQFQFQVLRGNQVIVTGPIISKVVSSGASWTATGAETQIGYLDKGLDLTGQVRAARLGLWGQWSAKVAFRTNALPSTPINMQPPSGTSATARPTITFQSIDTDDAEGSEVQGEVEITNELGVTVVYQTGTFNVAANEFTLATTATHFPAPGTFIWRCRGVDVSASDGQGPWSNYQSFIFQAGLGVVITSPTELQNLIVSTPLISFTIDAGVIQYYRYQLFDQDGGDPIYDSQVQPSTVLTIGPVPPGVLLNNKTYDLAVWAQNTGNQSGWSSRRQFSIAYNAPVAVSNPRIALHRFPGDPEDTSVQITWTPANIPFNLFHGYVVRRYEPGKAPVKKTILSLAQNRWLDAFAPANVPVTYTISTAQKVGADINESAVVSQSIDIPLSYVVLQSVLDPNNRIVLRWKPGPGASTRHGSFDQDKTLYKPWGAKGKNIVMKGAGTSKIIDANFALISDDIATREQHYQRGLSLYENMTEIQYKDERVAFFGVLTVYEYDQFDFKDTIKIRVEEINFLEGE